jgi:hypothetical protein
MHTRRFAYVARFEIAFGAVGIRKVILGGLRLCRRPGAAGMPARFAEIIFARVDRGGPCWLSKWARRYCAVKNRSGFAPPEKAG